MIRGYRKRGGPPKPNAVTGIRDKIALMLEQGGYSQLWLTRQIGVAPLRVHRWLKGIGVPTAAQAFRIAQALDVSLVWLCDEEQTNPSPPPFEGRPSNESPPAPSYPFI